MARQVAVLLLLFVAVVYSVNPVLFFPGYSLSKLHVTVTGGTIAGCPTDGEFTVEYQMAADQGSFDQVCMMKYLEIIHTNNSGVLSFSNRPDVTVTIPGRETGNTACYGSGLYNDFTQHFVDNGYTINNDNATFRAACFDWRMDPSNDVLAGPTFLENTRNLVEAAYASAGNQKVWLIGHSNGPIQILHFLNTLSNEDKTKYIAGFIPMSGNFAGQGLFPVVYVQGLSVVDFSFLPETADTHKTWTASYFSGPQPAQFTGDNDLIFLTTEDPAKSFHVTEADIDQYMELANNPFGRAVWKQYAGLVGPHTPPYVYTFALWGAGFDTLHGVEMPSFSNITITNYLTRDGDYNQEDIDNKSPLVWATTMPAGCFESWEVQGVDHFQLNTNTTVIARIFSVVSNPPSSTLNCIPGYTPPTTSTTDAATTSASTTTGNAEDSSSASFIIASLFSALLPLVAMF